MTTIRKEHGIIAAIVALLLLFRRAVAAEIEKRPGDAASASISFEAKGQGIVLAPLTFSLVNQTGQTIAVVSSMPTIVLTESWQGFGPYLLSLVIPATAQAGLYNVRISVSGQERIYDSIYKVV